MSSQETTLCHSIKNKNDYTQCPRKCKGESKFCGIHLKMNNPTIYDENMNITMVIKCNNLNNKSNKSKIKPVNIKNKNKKNNKNKNKIIKQKKYTGLELEQIKKVMDTGDIYTSKVLLDKCIPINIFKVKKIRYSLIKCNLHELINIKTNKKELLKQFSEYYSRMTDYDTKHYDKIVKIQAIARGYITRMSLITVNDEDFYTCSTKYEIPKIYYISYWDDKLQYFFDIRSLYKLYIMYANKGKVMKNPYNMKEMPFSLISKMLIRIAYLDASPDHSIDFEEEEKKEQKSIENVVSDLFYELDRLDNFTEQSWFTNLDMKQLKKLYENSADLWYYRTAMTHNQRCQIVSNGHVFNLSISSIYNFSNHQKDELRRIIVTDFYRMITEGVTLDDKKLGAILVLTALTTVSNDARNAMPQYVQDF